MCLGLIVVYRLDKKRRQNPTSKAVKTEALRPRRPPFLLASRVQPFEHKARGHAAKRRLQTLISILRVDQGIESAGLVGERAVKVG